MTHEVEIDPDSDYEGVIETIRSLPEQPTYVKFEYFEFEDEEGDEIIRELIENPWIKRVYIFDSYETYSPYLLALAQAGKFPLEGISEMKTQQPFGYPLNFSGLGIDNQLVEIFIYILEIDIEKEPDEPRDPKNILDLSYNPRVDDRLFSLIEDLQFFLHNLSEIRINGTGISARKVSELERLSPGLRIVGLGMPIDSLYEKCI